MRVIECWQCGNVMGVWRSNEDNSIHKYLGEIKTQSNICCRKCYFKEKRNTPEPDLQILFN